ncbi:MAG: tetratricopeptide repeat protein [Acidobacteria bacterium]|nr:tetratricopeptide repeat protein [Acidobacteriota bacterium]
MLAKFCFVLRLISFTLLFILSQATFSYAGEAILALPFENISGRTEYNWIGEGFSISISNLLNNLGLTPLDVEERNLAYERLGLSPTVVLTRASAIKIGEKAGADIILIGNYNILGEGKSRTIIVTSRMIDLREGRAIGNDYTFNGTINDLQVIQGKLAWEVLSNRISGFAFSREQIINRATVVPSNAFESYVKASLTSNRDDKVKFLFRAISEYQQATGGQYPDAVFTLGHLYYDEANYKDGLNWLDKVGEKDNFYLEAQFYRAVACLQLGDNEKASTILKPLTNLLPLYEVFNNAAALELRKFNYDEAIKLLGLAIQASPRDNDLLFNYGYTFWRAGQYSAAANQLNQLIKRETKDGQAYYILAKSLEKMNQSSEASLAVDEAKKNLPDFAKWETSGKIPILMRLKDHFSRTAYLRLVRSRDTRANTTLAKQAEQIDTLLAKAQGFFIAGRDKEAIASLNDILKTAPDNSEAHLLIGRLHERNANIDAAITSLKAAIFWNPKLVPAHVLLGRIYFQKNDLVQAKTHLKQALSLSPQDRDALALQRLIEPENK